MNDKIARALKFIRETRDGEDSLEGRILFFVVLLLLGMGIVFIASFLIFLAFDLPRIFIPMYFTIFILWHVYKRL